MYTKGLTHDHVPENIYIFELGFVVLALCASFPSAAQMHSLLDSTFESLVPVLGS